MRKKLFGVFCFFGLMWTQAHAAPLCAPYQPPPLGRDFNDARCVLIGHFANAQDNATGLSTDFIIDNVLKDHDFLKGPKVRKGNGKLVITLPDRTIPDAKSQFIIFCDVFKGEIDAYRGIKVQKGGKLVQYLKGAAALQNAPPAQRLSYCFKYLDSRDSEVAADAFLEFSRAPFKDYKKVAKKLPADSLANFLQNPKTPPERLGLYATLLGLCGKPEHAKLLRKMIDDPELRILLDGILVGYVSLQPREGWKVITGLLRDSKEVFLKRYAALLTARFLRENRPDLISKKVLEEGVALLLNHDDMADFAIEDLRKWKCWEMTDRILALFGQKRYEANVIKRAILRFALQSPLTSAGDFVRAQQSRDPEWVRDTEELLKLEKLGEAPGA